MKKNRDFFECQNQNFQTNELANTAIFYFKWHKKTLNS